MFTPDSSKLIMATTVEPYILILDLSQSTIGVIARLDDHIRPSKFASDRVVLPAKAYAHSANKNQSEDDADVNMENGDKAKSDDSDSEDDGVNQARVVIASIRRIAVSVDGEWLATADNLSRTHVFNLDLLKHHSMLPSFPHTIDVLAFDTQATHHLLLGFPNNTLQLYDVEARQFLPSWSSKGLATAPDPLVGVAFDPRVRGRALLWGSTWMCRVGLDRSSVMGKRQQNPRRRRKRDNGWLRGGVDENIEVEGEQEQELRMINRYRPVLYAGFFDEGELIVVERPLVDVFAGLPPAFYKPRYGRT
jgi:U3 small nucleolar RNA-associated protein 4